MFYDQFTDYQYPGFPGPYSVGAQLLTGAAAVPAEGVWAFSGASKVGSLEVFGSMSTLSVQAWGTNSIAPPLNQYVVTLAGSPAINNTVQLTFTGPSIPGGSRVILYTLLAAPTVTIVAAALAGLISSDPVLAPLGFSATSLVGVLTISYPSVAGAGSLSSPALANATTLALAVTGGGITATAAFGTTGFALGSAITALGLTALTVIPRWITARLTTLTGSGAVIGVNFNGAC